MIVVCLIFVHSWLLTSSVILCHYCFWRFSLETFALLWCFSVWAKHCSHTGPFAQNAGFMKMLGWLAAQNSQYYASRATVVEADSQGVYEKWALPLPERSADGCRSVLGTLAVATAGNDHRNVVLLTGHKTPNYLLVCPFLFKNFL